MRYRRRFAMRLKCSFRTSDPEVVSSPAFSPFWSRNSQKWSELSIVSWWFADMLRLRVRGLNARSAEASPERRMIMKKTYSVGIVAMLMGVALNVAAAGPAPTGIKNVVLVHGAFADGSGWDAVAKILEKDGYTVSVAQPPETSYADDQKYTKAAIDAMGGRVVLVGHSYGGSIISEAGNDPNVAALVYIAAFALDEGESCASIETAVPQASKAFKPDSNGNWRIEQDHFAADFAADIPPAQAHFMAVSQVPISTD